MCKHEFEVKVTEETVVTYCSKCGKVGEIESKPFMEYVGCPRQIYPWNNPWYNPQPEYPWYTTPGIGDDWYVLCDNVLTDPTPDGTVTWSNLSTATTATDVLTAYDTGCGTCGNLSASGTLEVGHSALSERVEVEEKEETMDEMINRIASELSIGQTDLEDVVNLFFGLTPKK